MHTYYFNVLIYKLTRYVLNLQNDDKTVLVAKYKHP